MLEELTPTHITEFNGLYSRGPAEVCPPDHFNIANNIRYISGGFETRYGTTLSIAVLAGVRRFFPYSIEGQSDRIIYLDTTGKIFDSLYPGVPILDIVAMTDFSMVVMNDRAYLSPHNGITGLPGEIIYLYQGAGVAARPAAGNPPSGFALVAANSPDAGYVEEGWHLYAVAFETDSGFITRPGPTIFALHLSEGAFKTRLTGIPIGPAGTVARHILATQIINNYDGNQYLHELFFVEGFALEDNVTTEIDLEFYDSQLVRSADYLKDEMITIPAVLGFTTFAGSLVGWAPNIEPSSVYISKAGEPESISLIEGGIEVDKASGGGVKNCVSYRGASLMIHKSGRVYSTANNGSEPVYWEVQGPIDMGVGSTVFGVAAILDEEGNTVDRYVFASRKGIIAYEGNFENVITAKIEDLWARVNKLALQTIQMVLDPIDEVLYIAVPLDAAMTPSHILYCDYSNGLSVTGVRWAIWNFTSFAPTSIGIDVDVNGKPVFKIASVDGNIYEMDPVTTADNFVIIPDPTWQTAYVGNEDIAVNYFGGIRLRATGTGALHVQFGGLDNTVSVNAPAVLLSASPGRFQQCEFNLLSQKGRLKIWTDGFGERFKVTKVSIFHKPYWVEEPS